MDPIICENCGKPVQVDKALRHQMEEKIRREAEIAIKAKFDIDKKNELEEKERRLREEFEKKNKDSNLEKEQALKKQKELEDILAVKEKEEKEKEAKIKEEAEKAASDKFHNEKLQYEKKIIDMQKSAEEVQRKGKQGSQQLQGDVGEIELEEQLKTAFPNDKISPVVTGKVGGDIIQEVWDSRGNYNGKILWELKNTQPPWKEDWLNKLNVNKRSINANDAVLISEVLPKDTKNFVSFQKGIWITKKSMALVISMGIRAKIIHGYYLQESAKGKNEKIERLYTYLSGPEFQHRMEAIIESYANMQVSIEKERNYFTRKWAKEEKNLRQLIDNTQGMRGDLEGIGAEMLELKEPNIQELEDKKNETEQETLV